MVIGQEVSELRNSGAKPTSRNRIGTVSHLFSMPSASGAIYFNIILPEVKFVSHKLRSYEWNFIKFTTTWLWTKLFLEILRIVAKLISRSRDITVSSATIILEHPNCLVKSLAGIKI